jgi:hypothetical protein
LDKIPVPTYSIKTRPKTAEIRSFCWVEDKKYIDPKLYIYTKLGWLETVPDTSFYKYHEDKGTDTESYELD